jgi:excisionase family DNA binding protein
MPDEPLLTEQELAEYCRVSLRTVQRWRNEGTGPPALWAGDRPRYRRDEVDAWLRRRAEERERGPGDT